MTPETWTAIALALADLRARLLRREHGERAAGVELAARTICRTLRSRSRRFNHRKFMSLALERR